MMLSTKPMKIHYMRSPYIKGKVGSEDRIPRIVLAFADGALLQVTLSAEGTAALPTVESAKPATKEYISTLLSCK